MAARARRQSSALSQSENGGREIDPVTSPSAAGETKEDIGTETEHPEKAKADSAAQAAPKLCRKGRMEGARLI
jgi:hypothetical protein